MFWMQGKSYATDTFRESSPLSGTIAQRPSTLAAGQSALDQIRLSLQSIWQYNIQYVYDSKAVCDMPTNLPKNTKGESYEPFLYLVTFFYTDQCYVR